MTAHGAKQDQTRQNGAKHGQPWPNGVKWGKAEPNGVTILWLVGDHSTLGQNRGLYGHTNCAILSAFELQKSYLHQNGVEFEEELNGMPYYGLWTRF